MPIDARTARTGRVRVRSIPTQQVPTDEWEAVRSAFAAPLPRFTLEDLDKRCEFSWLPAPTCVHCRPDVQARLAEDPVFAAWLDHVADNPDA
jgi:hypothetical protein